LAERILVVAAEQPTASRQALLRHIVYDRELPADTRMAIAERLAAGKGVHGGARRTLRQVEESQAALFAIVQDAGAAAKGRRKAAAKLAAHLAPMKPANKRWRFEADECGFAINAEIAKEYRELDFELQELRGRPDRALPTIAKIIRKLEAKHAEIVARLECPAPGVYSLAQIWNDRLRLAAYARKREDGIVLSAAEDADEAHRKTRLDCYVDGPEQSARRYRMELERAERNFKSSRLFKDIYASPLTRKQRDDLRLLRALYPPPHSTTPKPETEEERLRLKDFDEERARGHPFHDEEPAADGNFYPHDSKLRPPEPEIVDEFADVPPYSYFRPGVGPVFGYDPNVDPKTDTSFRPLNPPAE
jgi:hypothetical protein